MRNGKIARLPHEIREELNRRMRDGERGKQLLAWLNALPQTIEVVVRDFGGVAVSKQNLCEWRRGGFKEWQARQELYGKKVGELAAESNGYAAAAGGQLMDHLATVLGARYAVAFRRWKGPATNDLRSELRTLRGLCQEISVLRRGDHRKAERELRAAASLAITNHDLRTASQSSRELVCNLPLANACGESSRGQDERWGDVLESKLVKAGQTKNESEGRE